jgi:hypothetical protein
MPRARNRAQRAIQVLRWIDANWPIGRPVEIVWVDRLYDQEKREEYDAETERVGRRIRMQISRRRNRTWRETADTVIHECTHAMQWPVAGPAETALDDHPPSFWAQKGEIDDHFHHRGGYADADEFGWG